MREYAVFTHSLKQGHATYRLPIQGVWIWIIIQIEFKSYMHEVYVDEDAIFDYIVCSAWWPCGMVPDLRSQGRGFESHPWLLCTANSACHQTGVS